MENTLKIFKRLILVKSERKNYDNNFYNATAFDLCIDCEVKGK